MPLKLMPALRAAARLVRSPFDFTPGVAYAEALSDWAPIRAAYRAIVAELPEREREELRALTVRPIDVAALLRLPEGTLGHAYATFLRDSGLSPTAQVDVCPDIEEAFQRDWVLARFARVHDIHHALLGFGSDPHGELGLQAFNARNFREPHAFLAMASLPMCALRYGDPARFLREVARGFRLGGQLPNLMTVRFEEMFEMKVEDVRAKLGAT